MSRVVPRGLNLLDIAVSLVVSSVLISALYVALWWGYGRYELNTHWGTADQMLGYGELRLYVLSVVLGLPAGVCLARHLVASKALARVVQWPTWQTRLGLLLPAVFAALGAFLIAHFVIHYAWFTDDEQAYLLQANLYAKGMLTAPVIEPKALFRQLLVVEVLPKNGVPQWTGVYPPFQPFLIALSSFLGSTHLSQYLCVGLITYNTGRLAQRLFGLAAVGPIAAWLCATSPMLLGLGSTLHTSILGTTLTVFVARLVLWNLDAPGVFRGMALGLVSGSIVLARPLEGTLVTFLAGLVLFWMWLARWWASSGGAFGGRWAMLRSLLGMGLGGLAPLALMVSVNLALTGHPLRGAYSELEKDIGRFMGFGTGMMWGRMHSPELGVLQTVSALVRVNAFAFGWPLSLGLVLLTAFKPLRHPRVLLLLCISLLHVASYFSLAFGSVHDFGHAYHVWHLPTIASVSAWVLVRVRALALEGRLVPDFERFLRLAVASMAVVAVTVFWPAQIRRWYDVSEVIWAPIRAAEVAAKGYPAIVLWHYIQAPKTRQSWVFAPPAALPDGQLWWAFDSPGWYPELKRRYPDRSFLKLTWSGNNPVVSPARL
jgi:hypothetical protein